MSRPVTTIVRFLARRELVRVRLRSGCVAEIDESHEDGFHHPALAAHGHEGDGGLWEAGADGPGEGAAVESGPVAGSKESTGPGGEPMLDAG
jgi:hypothetical protein